MKNNKLNIEEKELRLKEVAKKLKSDFIGLDTQIDKIIDNIKIWYIMPELLTRPVIVNLWGMTGTGKTDLVRKLAKYLELSDKLFEVQMDSDVKAGYSSVKTLKEALSYSDIDEDDQGIILLDEFQRFRTIASDGSDNKPERFSDTWMLLSDGVFNTGSSSKRGDLEEEMAYYKQRMEEDDNPEEKESTEPSDKPKEKFGDKRVDRWSARRFKKLAKLKQDIFELVGMKYRDLIPILEEKIQDQNFYSGDNYKKSLIFVCGNIDSAYEMSRSVSDADQNADILHKYSKKINVVKIKQCLSRLFKPEQIARLGNNHVIYWCLNTKNYKTIISKTLDSFFENVNNDFGIRFVYDEDLINLLYKNFVYPSQGVRPVFSGINSFLSKITPDILFKSISGDLGKNIMLKYDKSIKAICLDTKGELDVDYDFDLDYIKKKIPYNKRVVYAVHEAGHALVYAKLFGYAPKMINIQVTNFDGAFVIPNEIYEMKSNRLDLIKTLLAGTVAEEIVFGELQRTIGCSNDIEIATKKAAAMIRFYGFYDYVSSFSTPQSASAIFNNLDIMNTNKKIEEILKEARESAKTIINENRELLKKISDKLLEKNILNGKEFSELLSNEIPNLKWVDPLDLETDDEIIYDYDSVYQQFKTDMT